MKDLYPIVNHNFGRQYNDARLEFEKMRIQAHKIGKLAEFDDMLEIACQLNFDNRQKKNFLNKILNSSNISKFNS